MLPISMSEQLPNQVKHEPSLNRIWVLPLLPFAYDRMRQDWVQLQKKTADEWNVIDWLVNEEIQGF